MKNNAHEILQTAPEQHFKNMKITHAELSDLDQVFEVCAQNRVANNREKFTDEEFAKNGFLMTQLTKERLEKMLADPQNYFLSVAKEGEEVVGYLAGYDATKIGQVFLDNNPIPEEMKSKKIFYYKQIAKKPGTKNIGGQLIVNMFDEVKKRGYFCVVCHIVHKPIYNQASISFHQKFGFKEIGSVEEKENAVKMGVYLKVL